MLPPPAPITHLEQVKRVLASGVVYLEAVGRRREQDLVLPIGLAFIFQLILEHGDEAIRYS
jgi:hypothetical protein